MMNEARDRGATTLGSATIYTSQINTQFKAITGKDLPDSAFAKGLSSD